MMGKVKEKSGVADGRVWAGIWFTPLPQKTLKRFVRSVVDCFEWWYTPPFVRLYLDPNARFFLQEWGGMDVGVFQTETDIKFFMGGIG